MANADYKIGLVGVGRMGANIARHLNDEGFDVTAVYDVAAERAQALAAEIGATASGKLTTVTDLADYIITVVTDDAAMRTIFSDDADDSLLKGASGKVFINCATISPQVHVDIEQLAANTVLKALKAVWQVALHRHAKGRSTSCAGVKRRHLTRHSRFWSQ